MRAKRLIVPFAALLVAVAVTAGTAAAQSPVEPQTASSGIRWVSGGVGMDETFALQQMEGEYN
ncbi:MAG TPA: hypothetical protein VES39_10025, partial [Rhodospirillales bacterium]|nr:hypothetical protein [Rhodospirillales bacterium]